MLNKGRVRVVGVAVFVVDGHDIELYPDAEGAARQIEGYDAASLDYYGADGTVYLATVEGPEWGPVTLHRTQDNRLRDLVQLLRAEAEARGLSVPPETPDDPATIWGALLAAHGTAEGGVALDIGGGSVARRKHCPRSDFPLIDTTELASSRQ